MSGGDGGAAHACFTCHGLDGAGDGDAVPRLAGLEAGYLHKQLEDYASGLREDATMAGVARRLNPHARQAVAAYYAGLPAPATTGNAALAPIAYGACVACHGPVGEGAGTAGPAISGQPAAYVADQLSRWREAKRRNDPRGVMRMATAGLSDAEIDALAAWLAAQSAVPAPASGGA
ncbi:c-type cytochrome [Phenylobacterium sp. J426]|uniref:c-type cytochrome n=1 Tax=Phenylobacterium sp. J426 TaxID=2898439 RepID=UPI0021513C87|nr:c-type cytochrome [Phenylobacterium sp. J426]MCR5875326.1 c-type cytochrome [Phenylobacterium sp. J426]